MQAQGYLFSRPKPVSEVPAMLAQIRPRIRAA
jgi:EAL domain-containing protein (putative c-di-GMP-specific phosphodiesterase class I)